MHAANLPQPTCPLFGLREAQRNSTRLCYCSIIQDGHGTQLEYLATPTQRSQQGASGEHFPPSCRLFVSEWSLNTFKPVLVSSWCWVDIALEFEDFQTTIGQASTNNSPNPRLSFGLSMKSATAACRATAPKKTIGWTASKSHLLQLATWHEGLSNTQICQIARTLWPCLLRLVAPKLRTLSRKSSLQIDCIWTLLCLEIGRLLYWA